MYSNILKTTLFLLVSLFFGVYGCDKVEPQGVGPSTSIYYILMINIQDVYGNDMIKGIGCVENSGKIKPELYQWDIIQTGKMEETIVKTDLGRMLSTEYEYLLLWVSSSNRFHAEKIIHKLKCPYIFGNNEEHTITTYWKHGNNNDECFCSSVEMDGYVFPVTKVPWGFGEVASVVLM